MVVRLVLLTAAKKVATMAVSLVKKMVVKWAV